MLVIAARRARRDGPGAGRPGCAAWPAPGLALSAAMRAPSCLMMAGMSLAVAGYLSANVLFWRLPSEAMEGRALAAGLAAVNALGNLGGFLGPYLMGALAARTGGPPMGPDRCWPSPSGGGAGPGRGTAWIGEGMQTAPRASHEPRRHEQMVRSCDVPGRGVGRGPAWSRTTPAAIREDARRRRRSRPSP